MADQTFAFIGEHVIVLTVALLAICSLLGFACLRGERHREFGVALLSGAVLSAVTLLLQIGIQAQTDATAQAIRTASYRDSVAMTQDLRGFDPNGRSLRRFPLSGKNLGEAQFEGTHLEESQMVGTDLTSAHLAGAHLQRANLFLAHLNYADLRRTDLRGADLRATVFDHATTASALTDGARVTKDTCWPVPLPAKVAAGLVPVGRDSRGRPMDATVGHVCDDGDRGKRRPTTRQRLCSDGSTVTVDPKQPDEDQQPETCEQRAE